MNPCPSILMPSETSSLRLTPWISGAGLALSTRSLTMPSCATLWPPSSHFSAPAASSRGRTNLRQRFRTLRNQLLNPSAKVLKSLTCNDAPASAPTGPSVVLGTSSSNSTATAPQASLIAALGDGGLPSLAHDSFPLQSSTMQPSKGKHLLSPGASNKRTTSHRDAMTSS